MSKIYALMYDNILVAKMFTEGNNQFLRLEAELPEYFRPADLFFDKDEVDISEFIAWIEDRVFPRERIGADELLKSIGMEDYCGFEIALKNRACLMEDGFWLSFAPDEDFKKITLRGAAKYPDIDISRFKATRKSE